MTEQTIHLFPSGALVALVGNPNCGKTAIFNALTGSRQKVANYAGVTVERKEGRFTAPSGQTLRILDLPGTYSLYPRSPDEQVTCDVLAGKAVLSRRLGVPVVETVGVKNGGVGELVTALSDVKQLTPPPAHPLHPHAYEHGGDLRAASHENPHTEQHDDQAQVRTILRELNLEQAMPMTLSDHIDRWVLHPLFGSVTLALLLFVIFQAVFSWSEWPMGLIETATTTVGEWLGGLLPDGILRSFVVDGLVAGVGGVLVYLPQIIVLFFFILLLEETGYLPRAALLLDRVMGTVGLSGRSFIPLLSSFACAIPGIMATRTIANPRDRLVTILIAPLMTCSARLPVYALLIGAFIPAREFGWGVNAQGVALFILYFAGIIGAFVVAWVLQWFGQNKHRRTLMLELPDYHAPSWKNLLLGLWQRVAIFLRRVGGIILTLTVIMWFLASFPTAPDGATGPAIEYSFAGMIGHVLNYVFAPIGFNWQISVALIPGLAAREVLVSALGTVYSIAGDDAGAALSSIIAQQWSLATAYSLLAWFVFAPQCLSTIAAIKRETGGWKMPLITMGYLFVLAYLASFITYRVALAWL